MKYARKKLKTGRNKGILIPIEGTQEGYNVETKPFHKECVLKNLWLYKGKPNIIVMKY